MNASQFFQPTILENEFLKLITLESGLIEDLAMSLFDPLSFYALKRGFTSIESIRTSVELRLKSQEEFKSQTFVYIDKATGKICGMSSLHEPGNNFKRIEIGFTWIATPFQRTYVNTQGKLLLLKHAFDSLGVLRVEFCVDPHNEKSNQAMNRLGARLEGCLRQWRHTNEWDPGDRNIYSILVDEYPQLAKKFS